LVTRLKPTGTVIILLLSLAGLIGCQGVSAAKPANQQQQTGTLSLGSPTLDFGSVTVGTSKTLTVTGTNTGTASIVVNSVAISTTYFALGGPSLPLTINPGQTSTFSVAFTPNAAGSFGAMMTVTTNEAVGGSGSTNVVALSGTGIASGPAGQLSVSAASLDLGSVVVGTSGSASASLSASGASVTVTAAASNNSQFGVTGLSLPVTIPAGQSVSFTVTFSPQATGAANATLTFTSNASPSSTTASLTGTGLPAPVHTVSLSWNASASSNVVGYNIYRAVFASSCGAYTKLNATVNTTTTYTDTSVTDGTTYCYAATAVNASSEESPYSNIATAQIPLS